jgi:hypothetical protein
MTLTPFGYWSSILVENSKNPKKLLESLKFTSIPGRYINYGAYRTGFRIGLGILR